jgi:hypothetical protein
LTENGSKDLGPTLTGSGFTLNAIPAMATFASSRPCSKIIFNVYALTWHLRQYLHQYQQDG